MTSKTIISPSILAANFAKLGEECLDVIQAGAHWIHFDVMDNHYVPNLTVGPMVCQSLVDFGIQVPIDVHLMTRPVDDLIIAFAKAGARYITFHPEACDHIDRSLQLIHDLNCKAGLALNPATPLSIIEPILHRLDLLLIMSVNPGFGGQQFIPQTLDKIKKARQLIKQTAYNILLEVDGGINEYNSTSIIEAGADVLVAGTAIFKTKDYAQAINNLTAVKK